MAGTDSVVLPAEKTGRSEMASNRQSRGAWLANVCSGGWLTRTSVPRRTYYCWSRGRQCHSVADWLLPGRADRLLALCHVAAIRHDCVAF